MLEWMPHDLARQEVSARRISPRRSRWPELDKFDARVAELGKRGQAASTDLQRLHEERRLAPERDAERLAEGISKGEKGNRPEPTAPGLDRQLEEAGRERDGLTRAVDDVLEDKSRYVVKHRSRLVARPTSGWRSRASGSRT